jgi:type I restriction enzyme S subunit
VRVKSADVAPDFLNWIVGSAFGKAYFLRHAKQTTGIATINMGQLKAFPLILPPREVQDRFVERLGIVAHHRERLQRNLRSIEALRLALEDRAFRGDFALQPGRG